VIDIPRLIYENIAIGIIIQRIGECKGRNNIGISSIFTQQTPLDRIYRDSIFSVSDKIAVIEFKAPEFVTMGNRSVLEYRRINIKSLEKIASNLGDSNVFLALVHAALDPKDYPTTTPRGLYLWYAVPTTTVFVPFKEIRRRNISQGTTDIDIKINRCTGKALVQQYLGPTCMIQCPLTKKLPWCASCGGLYLNFSKKNVFLDIDIHIPRLGIQLKGCTIMGYTLASLISDFIECKIGYEVTKDTYENIKDIVMKIGENFMLMVLTKDNNFYAITTAQST